MMREFNCDALKEIEVPETLIEMALNVPVAAGAAKAAIKPFRRMIAAAAVIFIGVLSISLYFLIRNINNKPLVAAPAAEPSAAESSLSANAPESPTEPLNGAESSVPKEPVSSEAPSAVPMLPTDVPTEAPAPSDPTPAPTPSPTQPVPSDTPTAIPTEPATEPPTSPQMNPSEEPTELPEPPAPSDPVAPQTDKELAAVGYMVPISSYTGSEDLYCRLYASCGDMIGSEELFDESHRVYFTTGSGYLFLSYPLTALVEPLPPDYYTIVFYDGDGNDFYICSAFLMRK